jgi:carbonic anhydrase
VAKWLAYAAGTPAVVLAKHPGATGDKLLDLTIAENVRAQLESLETHPSVAAALAAKKIKLHGWVYKFETGEVFKVSRKSDKLKLLNPEELKAVVKGKKKKVARKK